MVKEEKKLGAQNPSTLQGAGRRGRMAASYINSFTLFKSLKGSDRRLHHLLHHCVLFLCTTGKYSSAGIMESCAPTKLQIRFHGYRESSAGRLPCLHRSLRGLEPNLYHHPSNVQCSVYSTQTYVLTSHLDLIFPVLIFSHPPIPSSTYILCNFINGFRSLWNEVINEWMNESAHIFPSPLLQGYTCLFFRACILLPTSLQLHHTINSFLSGVSFSISVTQDLDIIFGFSCASSLR